MSSPYPVLGNRPIDQWKVTELKEELKRRKLMTKGLKEDLIKRLDEALRSDTGAAEGNVEGTIDNGLDTIGPAEVSEDVGKMSVDAEIVKEPIIGDSGKEVDEGPVKVQSEDSIVATGKEILQEKGIVGGTDSTRDEEMVIHATPTETSITVTQLPENEDLIVHATFTETSVTVTQNALPEITLSVPESQNTETQNESVDLPTHEDVDLNSSDPNNQVSEVSHILGFEVKSDSISTDSLSNIQKNELKDNIIADNVKLEIDVKPEMVQPSLNNVVPDGGKLHPMDVEKPREETVSVEERDGSNVAYAEINKKHDSSDVVASEKLKLDHSSGDDSMEEDVMDNKQIDSKSNSDQVSENIETIEVAVVKDGGSVDAMLDDNDDVPADKGDISDENRKATLAESSLKGKLHETIKKSDITDVGSSEKLNLEGSSGDDSMEQDAMDSKQIDSKYVSDEVRGRIEKTERTMVKGPVDVMLDDMPACQKNAPGENRKATVDVSTVKRKLHDQEAVINNETSKRQRRWNSESLKVTEPQSNSLSSSTTPKATLPTTNLKRSFSRSNSAVSEDAPKERVVPPSPNPPTSSLRIDRFLRPFTLKAVQELLGKTGTVTSFWMDQIKTHCYVTYSSFEEATETRNAVYNLQWPSNGGRLLVAEFVDPQEVKARVEAPPPSPVTPTNTGPKNPPGPSVPTHPPAPPTVQPQPSPRQQVQVQRQQLPPPPPLPLPPPPPLSNPPQVRERLSLPPPPPLPEKVDPPIVTLDDLFRKTKATPRIYYLPLSDEQVAEKLKAQGKVSNQYAGVAWRSRFGDGFWFSQRLLWIEISLCEAPFLFLLLIQRWNLFKLQLVGSNFSMFNGFRMHFYGYILLSQCVD